MFIITGEHIINSDHIVYAIDQGTGSTTLTMTAGIELIVPTAEVEHIWHEVDRRDQKWTASSATE
jgi:hypothetical protein